MKDGDTPANSMDVCTALATRRSVRDFRPDRVPEALIDDILSDALNAPSWGNVQPYRVAVASGDVAKAISADYMHHFTEGGRFQKASAMGKLKMWLSGFRGPDGDHTTIMTYPDELNERYRETGKGIYGVLGIGREDKAARVRQMARNFEFFGARPRCLSLPVKSLAPMAPWTLARSSNPSRWPPTPAALAPVPKPRLPPGPARCVRGLRCLRVTSSFAVWRLATPRTRQSTASRRCAARPRM